MNERIKSWTETSIVILVIVIALGIGIYSGQWIWFVIAVLAAVTGYLGW